MRKKLAKLVLIMFLMSFLVVMLGVGSIIYFSFGLPKITTLADYNPPIHSQILSKDGTVLADIGFENREIVQMDEIPKMIIDTFLSAEDASFYDHKGVDYFGILRAFVMNVKAGKVVQGGSTITQQVAKSLLLTRERSIIRKIKDLLLARRIESRFSKEEILFLYLNQIYLGGGYYGIKAAFKGYFGKELNEVTIAESAMIAGLLVAPGKYSPYINPEFAKIRQQYVLKQLRTNQRITIGEYKDALREKIKYQIKKPNMFKAGYFTDWVRQRVSALVGEEKFLRGGFKVVTTLDYEIQKIAEEQVSKGVREIDKRQGYKGPLGRMETVEEIEEYEINFQKSLLKGESSYFTISDNFEKIHELSFMSDNYEARKQYNDDFKKEVKHSRFMPGIYPKDSFPKFLDIGKMYDAVVTKVDDGARIVYISVGGVPGIIPYHGYNWAHERNITEERHYYSYVIRPSSVLKKGDVIKIEIKKRSKSVWYYTHKDFRPKLEKFSGIKKVKKQRYLLCDLTQEVDAQGAFVAILPKKNEILAFVGGSDFSKSQFNRAVQSKRQPGSSFKPLLYAAGLEYGFTPASIVLDAPEALGGADENLNWKPNNYDGKFKGPMTFRNALEQSRNVPTIKIADKIGVNFIFDFVDRIGFEAEMDHDLSLALGSFGVTLLDLVSTYALFPNGGKLVDPKSVTNITDRHGKEYKLEENDKLEKILAREAVKEEMFQSIDENNFLSKEGKEKNKNPFQISLGGKQVYDRRLSYLMTNLLRGVIQNGTGRRAKNLSSFIGGKTGTTNNYVDAWFIGFSSNVTAGVWTGFDDNKTLGWGETGAKAALPVWREVMRSILRKYGEYDFTVPSKIVNVLIDKETGKLANTDKKGSFMETFIEGSEPGIDNEDDLIVENGDENEASILEDDEYYNFQ